MRHAPRLALLTALLPAPCVLADEPIRLEHMTTIDVPGFSIEIVQHHPALNLLLATNPHWKTVDVFDVASLDPPVLHARDLGGDGSTARGIATGHEPTSIALHPTEPIVLVATVGRSVTERGRLLAFDLRDARFGERVLDQEVGFHPDCVGVSPDGRWAVLACEGEGHPDSPGSIWAVDLAGLTADRRAGDGALPAAEVGDLAELLQLSAGEIEPEYVGFDPRSRFAAVSCQENDRIVYVDLQGAAGPTLAGFSELAPGGEPDGVAVLADTPHPDDPSRLGCLVAVAEEGSFDDAGTRRGQNLTLLWVDPAKLGEPAVRLSSTHVPTVMGDDDPNTRRDPESLVVFRRGGRHIVVLAVERGDFLLAFDVTDPRRPVLHDRAKVGDRPEGITLVDHPDGPVVITGDEGKGNQGPGTVSFTRVTVETNEARVGAAR